MYAFVSVYKIILSLYSFFLILTIYCLVILFIINISNRFLLLLVVLHFFCFPFNTKFISVNIFIFGFIFCVCYYLKFFFILLENEKFSDLFLFFQNTWIIFNLFLFHFFLYNFTTFSYDMMMLICMKWLFLWCFAFFWIYAMILMTETGP